ncbi:hypothetical protein B6N60_02684 [Richelia sinica FACHB-800]|uniref:Uncharacterized protein n=1 Tax=Richelia sinica FACHB-800 TaxID=1357546 RepID=A0A975Y596_9NOST|nr:hypothetical protein B6N60_02684 [Richelia sinica FACHB-800]
MVGCQYQQSRFKGVEEGRNFLLLIFDVELICFDIGNCEILLQIFSGGFLKHTIYCMCSLKSSLKNHQISYFCGQGQFKI